MNNKVNINPDDVKFVVDEENRKVICYIEGVEDLFIDFVENNSPLSRMFTRYGYDKNYRALKIKNRYVGVATCAPDDEWNEEYGRRLAYHKMRAKINSSFFKRGNLFANMIDEYLNRFCDTINLYGDKLYRNTKRREEILGLNENFEEVKE